VRRYADVVRRSFRCACRPVRFHARGTAQEYSDIDVAVLVDRIEGDL